MQQLIIEPFPGVPAEIGRWLWGLQEVRRRTLRLIDDLDPRAVDWEGPDGEENAIGSLLHHIAGVEMGWLFLDIKGMTELPPDVAADFPHEATEPGGTRLKRVLGVPLAEHRARLERTRTRFLQELNGMTIEAWRTATVEPLDEKYAVSPEWAVFHLIEHEAGHALQISAMKRRAARAFADS